jgi:hypothetical protein
MWPRRWDGLTALGAWMTSPVDVVDAADPGDEVIRRFRFQIGYAALKTIALTDPESIGSCIYCEQFEDVLIELKDGTFIGTQIKTRELDQQPLKTTDEAVLGAIVKFIHEDIKFPGRFSRFCLATNYAFYTGEGADDLRVVIDCSRANPTLDGLTGKSSLKKTFKKIIDEAKVSLAQATATLAKLELDEMLTGIDLDLQIVQALSEMDGCNSLPHLQLQRSASLLKERVGAASSKAHQLKQIDANAITLDITARTIALTIANKRLNHQVVHDCISSACTETLTRAQELLAIQDYLHRDGEAALLAKMVAKMSAGELSAMDIEQFRDDVRSLEQSFLRWKEKYEFKEANNRLQHVQALALQQCREINDPTAAPSGFRHPVLTSLPKLRSRMATLATTEEASLFGCRPDHLRGAVGLLTEECRVWWSEPFNLEGKP